MLVCPQCQFENLTCNKFCQECGTSLTQNTCPNCDSLVAFDQLNCQNCGAVAGIVWWAVIAPSDLEKASPAALLMDTPEFLDLQHRYKLLELVFTSGAEQCAIVLDCQPFQLSLLEAVSLQQTDAESDLEAKHPATEGQGLSFQESLENLAVPAIAKPYLALCGQFYPAIPAIHDAWEWSGRQVVLLEERSHFVPLIDLWRDADQPPQTMQILHWLYQMTQLWHALEPWQKQQSLLELDNLRVDDDHTLCLKQLCSNQPNETPTLQDLGNLWRQLFAESQKTQVDAIMQLLVDLEAGKLRHSEEITNRLEAIANELEPPTVDPESTLEELAELAIEQITPMTSPPASADISASVAPTRLEVPADLLADDLDSSEGDDMPTVVLPMQLFALEEIGRTDIGRQRDHNEDYFGIETQVQKLESPSGKTLHARNLYILCDGMGGHASGEVASALAVDTIRKFFKERWQEAAFTSTSLPDLETMNQAVQLANKAIFDVNQQNARSGSGRMGTTLVMLVIQDTEAVVAHVGDSRLYRYTRKRGLEQITVDHEVGQREIQRGVDPETAYARPDAYQLTQALGPRDEHFVKPEVQYFELNEDMLLLLCSDGLSDNNLLETNWETHISPLLSSQTNLDKGVSQLIEMANRFNGHDNITAIAIRAKVRPSLDHLR